MSCVHCKTGDEAGFLLECLGCGAWQHWECATGRGELEKNITRADDPQSWWYCRGCARAERSARPRARGRVPKRKRGASNYDIQSSDGETQSAAAIAASE
jgi:hypothetical protein